MPLAQRSERGLNDVLGGRYNPKMILWPFDPLSSRSRSAGRMTLHYVGFQTVLARGSEYAATDVVTIESPESFPGQSAHRTR